jgi:parallel beta-helix repeat protein
MLDIYRSGAEGAYITYQAYPGDSPILESKGRKWNTITVKASFIIIKNLILRGNNQALSLSDAKAAEIDKRAGGTNWDLYSDFNTNGISVSGSSNPHHVEIRGCTVHDFPGGGIGGGECDYITFADNIVYNNCWFGMWGTSGISIFGPNNLDNTTGYKIKIIGNISYNNKPQVPYTSSSSSKLSDGSGIIIDANNGTQGKVVYTGRTLVENNICYNNGGGGIHIFQAHRVDVINNTTFENEQVLAYGNIDALYSDDIKFINNIAYAKSGGKANDSYNNTNVIFDYNIYFNGSVKEGGYNSKTANPLFIDAANGNFMLQSNSPAINAGTINSITGSTYDILNNPRIKNGRTDCGAYEIN